MKATVLLWRRNISNNFSWAASFLCKIDFLNRKNVQFHVNLKFAVKDKASFNWKDLLRTQRTIVF